jgi:hypothetical protein
MKKPDSVKKKKKLANSLNMKKIKKLDQIFAIEKIQYLKNQGFFKK